MPSMEEMLRKYDTDGSIANLIELEREVPEAMLEAEQLEQVEAGSWQVRCEVCGAMCKVARRAAARRGAGRDEEALSRITSDLCVGTPAGSDAHPKYPGNPPLWGEKYSVRREGGGQWTMRPLPRGAPPEERAGEGGAEYDALLIKHAIISRACRGVESDAEVDLAELMYKRGVGGEVCAEYCRGYCAGRRSARQKDEV